MNSKMIRVTQELVDKLKTLKQITGNSSYSEVLEDLVHRELLKHSAYTNDGYLSAGTVVQDTTGNTLVIERIAEGKVVFNDSSFLFNGSVGCMALRKLADDVSYQRDREDV